ncbi:MAG: energy transducer TonB [Polyangiales bacterium]
MNLLRSMSRDAYANERWRFGSAPVEGPLTPEQLAEQRALDRNVGRITDRWREDALRAAPPPRPPGSSEYVRRVATAAARAWAPVRAQDPSIAEGLLRLLLAGSEGYRAAQADSLGMFANGRVAAGADAVNDAHPHSPMLQSNPTLNEVGRAAAQRIAVEIDVRQSADGRLVAISVARSSGSGFFDRQAIEAVRRAIEQSGARASSDSTVPTRTRWEFELRVARNPPFALGPQLPGAPTVFNLASGGVEWGGVDPPRPMYPFALHRYQRVRILWVTADTTPNAAAARGPTRDAGR